jgi:hypothetical protein
VLLARPIVNETYGCSETMSGQEAATIAPRAEFRVFGRGIIDVVKARMWDAQAVLQGIRRMPAEVYLLSRYPHDAIVKVGDGLLDIKAKTGVTPEGYEIFQPNGRFRFPVARDVLASVLSQLKVSIELTGDAYPIEAFVAIARRHDELVTVRAEKTRYGFTVNGVLCEYVEACFNGALMESACCESEDYGALPAVVEALWLSGFENVNYVRAAKQMLGIEA